jgi:hypothetical protein
VAGSLIVYATERNRTAADSQLVTNKKLLLAAFAGWLILLGCGWAAMARYGAAAGEQALAPVVLPPALKQFSAQAKPTLFLALHPQCDCSRATLHELRRVLQDAGADAPLVYVLLYRPSHHVAHWNDNGILPESDLGSSANVIADPEGRYAAMLHADTSGEVVLYARNGSLLFQGGITASRGHEGPSAGADRLQAALQNGTRSTARSSVFGCNIFHRAQPATGKS